MRTLNYKLFAFIAAFSLLGTGCSDEDVSNPNANSSTANSGIASQKNFTIASDNLSPAVIDPTTGAIDLDATVNITASVADRNNQPLSDSHTVFFETEWGLLNPKSCVTTNGSCSVEWSPVLIGTPANDTVGRTAGSPGNTIVAYTIGEEGFTDLNDNNLYDVPDGNFLDFPEPFISVDASFVYVMGVDPIIDRVNGNDLTGANGVHDTEDGFFNGGGCTHTTNCSTVLTSSTTWLAVVLKLDGTALGTFTVGGTMANLVGTVTLRNNTADDLDVSANGPFTFGTLLADTDPYAVTVFTQPTNEICTVTGGDNGDGTGVVANANVGSITVNCVPAFSVGGTLSGAGVIPVGMSIVIQNNLGDDITFDDTTTFPAAFTFPTQLIDTAPYSITVLNNAGLDCATTPIAGGSNGNGTGTIMTADVTDIAITCD